MSVRGLKTKPHLRPYTAIQLYEVALKNGLPGTTTTVTAPVVVDTTLFGVSIEYRLYANCVIEQGEKLCLFYVAYNQRAGRNEFVVGANLVEAFDDNARTYAVAAGNFHGLTGYTSDYQISHAAMVDRAMNADIVGAVAYFGDTWAQALQDPGWWTQACGAVLAANTTPPLTASTAARVRNPTQYPAVARALRTQENLQGLPVTRSVQLLEQPTVFRHTITYDPAPASMARIQQEGSLRFASASKAHYGEGVYAWRANATKIGARWIDIKVPAGTAAELIQTPSGSWYRLVPAEGNTLPVQVVGHNFTPAEVALGQAMVGK